MLDKSAWTAAAGEDRCVGIAIVTEVNCRVTFADVSTMN